MVTEQVGRACRPVGSRRCRNAFWLCSPPSSPLTGGGALVGFHTKHRLTRDLDLFFRAQTSLGELVPAAIQLLAAAGLSAASLRSSASFAQLDVRDADEAVVIDLVADPTPIAEAGRSELVATTAILVETPHQLLVNKLCALLSRSEIRDLLDVRVLLDHGGDLQRALGDCPRQDGGFSPLTFCWVLKNLPVDRLARVTGLAPEDTASLEAFRDELVERVVSAAHP